MIKPDSLNTLESFPWGDVDWGSGPIRKCDRDSGDRILSKPLGELRFPKWKVVYRFILVVAIFDAAVAVAIS